MIAWSLSHSLKPWSYGMCSCCRDPETQKWRKWLTLRGWPFGGQDKPIKQFPSTKSQIWTSGTCRNSSRVNCMSGSRDNVLQPNTWDQGNKPCTGALPTSPWSVAIISRSRHTIQMETVTACSCSPYLTCCTWESLIQLILTSKRTSAQS
jgi:hypothetical protein